MSKKVISECIKAFSDIQAACDLKHEKLTAAQHFEIGCTISNAFQAYKENRSYTSETISQEVCDWFMKHGAKVEPCGIGWRISF